MSAKPNLDILGIHREMAGININQIQKEWDTLFDFTYKKNNDRIGKTHISWDDYCIKYRDGDQGLPELSKLISSLCDSKPWRYIVSVTDLQEIKTGIGVMGSKVLSLTEIDIEKE